MTNYIGIDVGKTHFECFIPETGETNKITNNKKGFAKLLKHIDKCYKNIDDFIVVVEPTGGYEKPLCNFCSNYHIKLVVVHPTKVRNYARAIGILAKTDTIDAKLLSNYANNFSLQPNQNFKSPATEKLASLIKRRDQIIAMKNKEISRLETEQCCITKKSLKRHVTYLEKELEMFSKEITLLTENDYEISKKIKILQSIPAVGNILASTAICFVPELGELSFPKITALVGLAPFARDSGQYRGKRSIFAGRANFRKVLYMAAVSALRHNKRLKDFYDKLIANHKPTKVALVAVMRKLLGFMNALIKNNSLWEDNMQII